MSNSASASAAAFITGQSESDPITMPTRVMASLALVSQVAPEPRGGVPRALEAVVEVVAVRVDVADLAAGPQLLAVQVHPEARVAGQRVRVAVVQASDRRVVPAEDVHHHRPARAGRG